MRPHRQQPTRLPRPWDTPGKNTGVGCHFLLQLQVSSRAIMYTVMKIINNHCMLNMKVVQSKSCELSSQGKQFYFIFIWDDGCSLNILWSSFHDVYKSNHYAVPFIQWKLLSRVQHFVTAWTIQSMEFSRPEYCSGLPFPSLGDLPNPGIGPRSPALQADSLPTEPHGKPKLIQCCTSIICQ